MVDRYKDHFLLLFLKPVQKVKVRIRKKLKTKLKKQETAIPETDLCYSIKKKSFKSTEIETRYLTRLFP